jgi:hypothetical protein
MAHNPVASQRHTSTEDAFPLDVNTRCASDHMKPPAEFFRVSRETFFSKHDILGWQSYRVFCKNSEILFGLAPISAPTLRWKEEIASIIHEGAFGCPTERRTSQDTSAGGFSRC